MYQLGKIRWKSALKLASYTLHDNAVDFSCKQMKPRKVKKTANHCKCRKYSINRRGRLLNFWTLRVGAQV